MTGLPQYVRRLPYIFYALAIIAGGWRFWNEWTLASQSFQYADASETFSPLTNLARSTALYWAFIEAVYITGTAAFLQVAISIYDKIQEVTAE